MNRRELLKILIAAPLAPLALLSLPEAAPMTFIEKFRDAFRRTKFIPPVNGRSVTYEVWDEFVTFRPIFFAS